MKIAKIILHSISLIVALCGGLLAYADQWQALLSVSPKLAHAWQMFVIGAIIINQASTVLMTAIRKEFHLDVLPIEQHPGYPDIVEKYEATASKTVLKANAGNPTPPADPSK